MNYIIKMSSKFSKVIREMPKNAKETLRHLIDDMKETGPVQPKYHNFSALGKQTYHCHLAYHWVACWRCEKDTWIVEVLYVGSREKAPY
ncbi:hypothetical protein [uncultured Sphaerochaeta sp.]|uniref:hypothetical protein n=1 Tax=uncultured Sphaerochaeta sp. TaxID=886478 RepID=UPI0026019F49|nr:hypothetical protein [uncultured Sphaerochaeta sp.]